MYKIYSAVKRRSEVVEEEVSVKSGRTLIMRDKREKWIFFQLAARLFVVTLRFIPILP